MKKVYLINLLLVILLMFMLSGCKKSVTYTPETKEELKALVDNESISLGDIDTSKITDMSGLFYESTRDNFKGIEKWNVSKVDNMSNMFFKAKNFNQDIGSWNVSNVEEMVGMFCKAEKFNQDIGNWDVSKVKDMSFMFSIASSFNQDIGNWNVSNTKIMMEMFTDSPLENNPPAWYKEY